MSVWLRELEGLECIESSRVDEAVIEAASLSVLSTDRPLVNDAGVGEWPAVDFISQAFAAHDLERVSSRSKLHQLRFLPCSEGVPPSGLCLCASIA